MATDSDLVLLIEPLARAFYGEPNRQQSSKTELRFGSNGSLSVDLEKATWFDFETSEGGGVLDLVKRAKGFTEAREVFGWLESEGFLSAKAPSGNGKQQHEPLGAEVAHYDYIDEAGSLLFQVVRYNPKNFRQRAPDANGGWTWRVRGIRQVPYRLPELLEALANERTVVIAEGEKDVENLWALGIPATCNAGGAGKWRSVLDQFFIDADVVIIADNDPQSTDKAGQLLFHENGRPRFTGFDHAHAIAAELAEKAARVRVLDLGTRWLDCPPKGDISDWIAAGGTIELLHDVLEQLPDWSFDQATKPKPAEPAEQKRASYYVAPDPATIPRRAWLFGGHYIRQAATATVAPGGFGKTTLTLYEAISMVAAGLVVWYLSGEDPKVEIDRRIAAHCKHHGIDLASLKGRLFVDDRSTFNLFIGNSPKTASVKFDEASLKQFEEAILIDKIDVVMLDPFVSFHAVPENDNGCVDAVIKRIALIAYRTNSCIEISHHVRKPFAGQGSITVDDARGGGAIINAVRSGRVINRMSGAEALNAKVEDDQRASYIRVDRGKRNMAPADKAEWFHLASVFIDNGDNVQALESYTFPSLMDDITVDDTEWVRELVRKKRYRVDSQSKDWLGVPVAAKLGLDAKDKADRKKLHALIAVWLKGKVFKILELRDTTQRKEFDFYVALDARAEGEPAPGMPDNITPLFDRDDDD